MNKLTDYDIIIWDVDGTLYYQKPFRMKMLWVIMSELLFKPKRWREAFVIYRYRKLRETWQTTSQEGLAQKQYIATAKKCGISAERVEQIINYWMLETPNIYLNLYKDKEAVEVIRLLKESNKVNVVWSDYPAKDKLEALGIDIDECYCSTDASISAMKPNPKGIEVILEKSQISKTKAIMIGDRDEKDGQAARNAGIDCLILHKNPRKRNMQWKDMI